MRRIPKRSRDGQKMRSPRANKSPRLRRGTVCSKRRCSMAAKIASTTSFGGYLRPDHATGSSCFCQISVSNGPATISPTWMFEPARSFQRPSVKLLIAALVAA
jgi:hypothetical protein